MKLNGKTRIKSSEPYAPQICSVSKAVELGASAIGYTLYFGSAYEHQMIKEFSKMQEEAREHDLPVILWAYPRGNGIDESNTDVLAYAARASLELGADIIKIKYNHDKIGFKWVVKSAGKSRVLVAGGEKTSPEKLLNDVYDVMQAGVTGLAVGRNVWQSEKPLEITQALKGIIFENKTPDKVMRFLK